MIEELHLPLPGIRTVESALDLPGLVATYSTLLFRVANSVVRNQTEAEENVNARQY